MLDLEFRGIFSASFAIDSSASIAGRRDAEAFGGQTNSQSWQEAFRVAFLIFTRYGAPR